MKLHKTTSAETFVAESTAFITEIISETPTATIALSGGSTPGPIYTKLAQKNTIDFSQVQFFQVDERYVSVNHPDSNHKLITETLLSTPNIPKENFHYFDTALSLEECLGKYEQTLKNLQPKAYGLQPTLTLLGIGPDGHTASLFPNSPALQESERLVAHTTTDEFAVHDRLTITFPAIMASKALLVLMKGSNKKIILDKVIRSNESIESCPAKKLLEHPNLHIFFGDF